MSSRNSLPKTELAHISLPAPPALQPFSQPVSKPVPQPLPQPVSPSTSVPSTLVLNFDDRSSFKVPSNPNAIYDPHNNQTHNPQKQNPQEEIQKSNPQEKNQIHNIKTKPQSSRENSKPKSSRENSKKNAARQKLHRTRTNCIKVGLCIYHWDDHEQLITDIETQKECMKHKNEILEYF